MHFPRFSAHVNRTNLQSRNPNVWTIHTNYGTFNGKKIVMNVPTETVFDASGPQPRAYFTGRGRVTLRAGVIFVDGR